MSFVVDDLTPDEPDAVKPGMGRGVEIRGHADAMAVDDPPGQPGWRSSEILRIRPRRVLSWHIDPQQPDGYARDVD